MDEVSEPVTEEELREFLEADLTGVRVDREFKQRLRDRLWEIVKKKGLRRRVHAAPDSGTAPPQNPPSNTAR